MTDKPLDANVAAVAKAVDALITTRSASAQERDLNRFLELLLSDDALDLERTVIEKLPRQERVAHIKRLTQALTEAEQCMVACKGTNLYKHMLASSALQASKTQLSLLYQIHHSPEAIQQEARRADEAQLEDEQGYLDACAAVEWALTLWIDHPNQTFVLSKLAEVYKQTTPECPLNLFVRGASTVGKTEAVRIHCAARELKTEVWVTVMDPEFGEVLVKQRKIAFVECPPGGLASSLYRVILTNLGHPKAQLAKESLLMTTVCVYAQRCGLRQLIIDDINHAVQVGEGASAGTLRSQTAIYNFAKSLRALAAEIVLRKLGVSIVLTGVEHSKHLGLNNSQFANQFKDIVHFDPYKLSRADPIDAAVFKHRSVSVLNASPLPWSKQEPIEDIWLRLHWATHGSIGNLANLIKGAIIYGLARGAKELTREHLSQSYASRQIASVSAELGTRERARADPFVESFRFPQNTLYHQARSIRGLVGQTKDQVD